jgi:hypothetical protein
MGLVSSAYRKVAPARIEQRDPLRQAVTIKCATVRGHGRQPVEAELVDLSIYGCRLSVDAPFKADDRLWLRFAGDKPISGTTVWSEGDQLACRFDEPLDRDLFRALTIMVS